MAKSNKKLKRMFYGIAMYNFNLISDKNLYNTVEWNEAFYFLRWCELNTKYSKHKGNRVSIYPDGSVSIVRKKVEESRVSYKKRMKKK